MITRTSDVSDKNKSAGLRCGVETFELERGKAVYRCNVHHLSRMTLLRQAYRMCQDSTQIPSIPCCPRRMRCPPFSKLYIHPVWVHVLVLCQRRYGYVAYAPDPLMASQRTPFTWN